MPPKLPSPSATAGLLYQQQKKQKKTHTKRTSTQDHRHAIDGPIIQATSSRPLGRKTKTAASAVALDDDASATEKKSRSEALDVEELLGSGTQGTAGQLIRLDEEYGMEEGSGDLESDSSSGSSSSSLDSSSEDESDVGFDGFEDSLNGATAAQHESAGSAFLGDARDAKSLQTNVHPQTMQDAPASKKGHVVLDKDEEEKELEALVFGDSAGFRSSLQQFSSQQQQQRGPLWQRLGGADGHRDQLDEEMVEDEDGSDLVDVVDDDLFFVDADGSADVAGQIVVQEARQSDAAEIDGATSEEEAAWEDSDDARIRVSLAGVPRLRKLRITEDEDVVSGKEYIKRLQRQYLKLNPRPQWIDDAERLRQRRKRRKTSNGEDVTDSSDSDADMMDTDNFSGHRPLSDLLRDATSLTRPGQGLGKRKFRPEVIDIQRTKHIADKGPSAITTLQIHPHFPLLIASGPSSKLDLYHLHDNAPTYTSHLTSLWMKHHPFTTTLFHPLRTDPRIFLSARRRYFHVWNLSNGQIETVTRMYGHADEQRSMESFKIAPHGKYIAFIGSARKGGGVINFVDADTLQWIAQARIEGRGGIADFAWWRNGAGVAVAGKNGEITEYDLEQRRVIARWRDEGAVGTTTLALGGKSKHSKSIGGDAYIAIGSSAGIVNVYSRAQWFASSATAGTAEQHATITNGTAASSNSDNVTLQSEDDDDNNSGIPQNPKPLRALDQLTTPISHLAFAPNGQVLCMASRWKKDALRLVHLPSCTVYRNWPTSNTPLGRISAVCWGEIATGTASGASASGAIDADGVLKLVIGNEAGRIAAWDVRGE